MASFTFSSTSKVLLLACAATVFFIIVFSSTSSLDHLNPFYLASTSSLYTPLSLPLAAPTSHASNSLPLYSPHPPLPYNPATHVPVTSLCQPASMLLSNPNYTGKTEPADFYHLPLPHTSLEDGRWMLWEVDVEPSSGEVRLPLIEEVRNGGIYNYQFFKGQRLAWITALLNRRLVSCTFDNDDGTQTTSPAYLLHNIPSSTSNPPWLLCYTRPFTTPTRLTLTLLTATINTTRIELPLCTELRRRVYLAAQLKAYFSWQIDDILDWLDYHYKIGFDHFLLHYRWKLTEYEREALQPYIDSQLVELRYWPLREGKDRAEGYADQDMLMVLSAMRLRQYVQWVLAPDMDEYLYLTSPVVEYKQRVCNNSLHCTSPVSSFLDTLRHHSLISYYTWNFVPTQLVQPPASSIPDADRFRYPQLDPTALALPIPVQRVWKRQYHDMRAAIVAKWIYQPAHCQEWMTHGGGSRTRPGWADREGEDIHAKHYHAYMMPEADRDKYWREEAIRDTAVSDILLDDTMWPQQTNTLFLEARQRQTQRRKERVAQEVKAKSEQEAAKAAQQT